MQVKDIMKREVVTVSGDTPILDVAKLLVTCKIHAVPVVDEQQKVLGIVTETDFFLKNSMALHLPTYMEMAKQWAEHSSGAWESIPQIRAFMNATAKDVMTENCMTLPEVTDVRDMLASVRVDHHKTFPVTDYQGTLIGIVSLIDVVTAFDKI